MTSFKRIGVLRSETQSRGADTGSFSDSGGDWRIGGVSLRSPAMRGALRPQGGAYTAVELQPEGDGARRMEIVSGVLVAREAPEAVLSAMRAHLREILSDLPEIARAKPDLFEPDEPVPQLSA